MLNEMFIMIFTGFAAGLAVGSGFVAFLTVLGVIPRLMQLSKTEKYVRVYEWGVILGAVMGGWISLHDNTFLLPIFFIILIGLLNGVFVGLLAAALTEVLNVLPILAKRVGVVDQIVVLLMAIALGKVVGSLFHWLYFVDYW
ncbi:MULTISPECIES: stage V sporulation protein AB [Bacillaceae]|uniref:stage V sporulation protein AB n=1 Tax=Bacillaceae TaxID=186817 RepID=UPI001BDEA7C0|nr:MULTISPECIES: stage V sporulation protein AB [Bacillaceae]MDX8359749.1 stage V sporulation protein AB [Cytobacillus sp. IB215316]